MAVWKEGASADTSQLYTPASSNSNFVSTTCVALLSVFCGTTVIHYETRVFVLAVLVLVIIGDTRATRILRDDTRGMYAYIREYVTGALTREESVQSINDQCLRQSRDMRPTWLFDIKPHGLIPKRDPPCRAFPRHSRR